MPDAPVWRGAAIEFALAPARYIEPSWLADAPHGDAFRRLAQAGACARRLSRWVIESFRLSDFDPAVLETPRARLALMDWPLLERIALHVGAALRGDELRGVLAGAERARIREELGAEAFAFATGGSLLFGSPPAFGFEPHGQDLRARLIAIGAAFSLSPAAWADVAYVGRVRLKLPKPVARELLGDWTTRDDLPPDPALPPLTRRVVREVAPQWLPFFV
jgi:hypothetical protein